MPLTARSSCCGVRGGSTEMVGTTAAWAPWCSSRAIVEPDCSLVRGHEHLPAEQRLGLEPRQRLAHGHSGPHDGQHGEAPVGHRRAAAPRRGHHGALLGAGAALGDGHRGVGGAAGGDQGVERLGGPVGLAEHDDGDPGVDRAGEVGVPRTGDDDVDAGGRARRQRHAGVRRHRGDRADARHDLEGEPGLDAGRGLLGEAVEDRRVAVHQAHDEAAGVGLGGPHDELGRAPRG